MADDPFNEDAALRYVLGEGDPAERAEFESRMAVSVELQAHVNELQIGITALATTSPPQCPPPDVWRNIEKAVSKETQAKTRFLVFWIGWLRNGWAVATACLVGWLFYAFMAGHSHVHAPAEPTVSQDEMVATEPVSSPPKPFGIKSQGAIPTNSAFELLQARTMEILELRGKIAELQTVTTQLSHSLAVQHAQLTESNRIKFYHLVPASKDGNSSAEPLSPGLQIAVLTALARDLGWLRTTPPSTSQNNGRVQPQFVTIGGVDFIDLRPGSPVVVNQQQTQSQAASDQTTADNTAASKQEQPQTQAQTEATAGSSETTTSEPTIPAFISGNNLVVALDSTVVPTGSLVTLTASGANQNQTGGTFVIGGNPTVVTLPLNLTTYGSGGYIVGSFDAVTLGVQTPDGKTSTMQFSAPSTTNP